MTQVLSGIGWPRYDATGRPFARDALDALSAAADEITRDLAPGSVELRLRGRDPSFVVTPPPPEPPFEDTAARGAGTAYTGPAPSDGGPSNTEDGATARINFRVPEQLKAAIEEAAGREGRSVNAWLTQVASASLQPQDRDHRSERRGKRGAQRYTGWAR